MKPRVLLSALCVAVLASGMTYAQSFSYTVDADSVDTGLVDSTDFALDAIFSIDSIEIDIAHTWGGDLEITLTAPDAVTYVPVFDPVDSGGSGNFDLGVAAGDGSLANVATYTFVESGGLTEFDDTSGVAAAGTFNAFTWGGGPHAAGLWNLTINDDAAGDVTSIGSVTVNFTAVPEPTSAVVIMAGFGIAVIRRRR